MTTPLEAQELIAQAVSLYGAFVRGVASNDVRNGRMSRSGADAWATHTTDSFASDLRQFAARTPLASVEGEWCPDWTLSDQDKTAVALTLALSKHIPDWPGATDDQLADVAKAVLSALAQSGRSSAEPVAIRVKWAEEDVRYKHKWQYLELPLNEATAAWAYSDKWTVETLYLSPPVGPQEAVAGESRQDAEARIMQEYKWGNLTKLGVANHLRRVGFTMDYAVDKANALSAPPVGPQEAVAVTDEMVRKASNEYLMHKGERPWRVLRGGQELWETCALAMRAALVAALSPSGIDLGGEVERLTRERDTWKWAVEKKDKQLLEFAAHIEAARPLAEFAGALAALRQHHEQALAMMDDEYPDSPLYAETVDALAVKAHDAPTKTLMDNVRIVYDTFKRDLEQGYRTKDKTFAVELLGSALASLSNAVREGDDG